MNDFMNHSMHTGRGKAMYQEWGTTFRRQTLSIRRWCGVALAGVLMLCSGNLGAQEKLTVTGKADFVTDYIWRGADQHTGCAIQPSLSLLYKGFSLNVWGSQSLTKWEEGGSKEFDLNLGYTYRQFSITVSDYWWSGVNRAYGDYKNEHYFEGTLAYTGGASFPLSLTWSTMFAGADKDADNDLQASTYVNLSYSIALPAEVSLIPSVGFTPWNGLYHRRAACTDIALKAIKTFRLSDQWSMPLFVQAIVSPVYDRTYLVAGLSIGF